VLTQDYLSLQSGRLKHPDKWSNGGRGLWLLFAKGGAGEFAAGSISHRFTPGDVLILDAGLGGTLTATRGGEIAFARFSVCIEHLFPLFGSNEIRLLQDIAEHLKGARLFAAANPLAIECNRLLAEVPHQSNLEHRGQLVRLVSAILSEEMKAVQSGRAGFARVEDRMLQVFERLSVAELSTLSVGELAEKFRCSRRHLNRLFHQHFGCSVAALRMEMRLLKAASLLRDPDAKIINVAGECGFSHLGLFNTCFKRRFGASPGRWRRTALQAESESSFLPVATPDCPLRSKGFCPWMANTGPGVAAGA
jgi:AraC-like DNA-binding protein